MRDARYRYGPGIFHARYLPFHFMYPRSTIALTVERERTIIVVHTVIIVIENNYNGCGGWRRGTYQRQEHLWSKNLK